MNYIIRALLPLILIACSCDSNDVSTPNECFPDKGIKVAKTISGDRSQTIYYDRIGRPTLRIKPNGEIVKFEYRGDSLLWTIIESRIKPNFHFSDKDFSEADTKIDTGIVVKHHKDGKPQKMVGVDSTLTYFEYNGCQSERQTVLRANGDTIQQYELIRKHGILVETVLTISGTSGSSKYFDYSFNELGHWTKRTYQHGDKEVITEKRELTYY